MNKGRRFHTRQTTFRQLEIFKQVAEDKSVTTAATKLHLAQPTVSVQIAKLSDALGVDLFEKVGKHLQLTDMGLEVLSTARTLFDEMDRLETTLAQREGLAFGQLRISVVTTAKYLIPAFLGEFCRKFPGISPEFQIGNRSEIIHRLKQNEDDIYVFSNPPRELYIDTEFMTHNPLVVVAPSDHPLANVPIVRWEQLKNERILMREIGSGTRYAIEKHLAKHNFEISQMITIASNEAIKESVMAGLGIGIISRQALAHMAPGNIIELPVETFPVSNSWYWVTIKGKHLSPAALEFKKFVASKNTSDN